MSLLGLNSRYKNTATFIGRRGENQYALWEPPSDLSQIDESVFDLYQCNTADVGFLDRIAVQFFGPGTEWAWWVIAYVNGIIDPEEEVYSGMVLRIPPATVLRTFALAFPNLPLEL